MLQKPHWEGLKLRIFTLFLGLIFGALFLQIPVGCNSPTYENTGIGKDTAKITTDSFATIIFSNGSALNPGTLTFWLFAPTSTDTQTGIRLKNLGEVGEGKVKALKTPLGKFRIAYETNTGDFRPMTDADSTELKWPLINLVKDASYTVKILTDGNRNYWKHDIPVIRD